MLTAQKCWNFILFLCSQMVSAPQSGMALFVGLKGLRGSLCPLPVQSISMTSTIKVRLALDVCRWNPEAYFLLGTVHKASHAHWIIDCVDKKMKNGPFCSVCRTCLPSVWQQWHMGAGFDQQDMGQLQRMCKIPLPLQPQPWKGEMPLIIICMLFNTVTMAII